MSRPLYAAFHSTAGRGQPRIGLGGHAPLHRAVRDKSEVLLERRLRRADAQVGVVGDLQGAAARAFRQAALCQRLNPPGDAAEQEVLVVRPRLLAEHLGVLLFQLAHRHVAQRFNLFPDRGLQGLLLSRGR